MAKYDKFEGVSTRALIRRMERAPLSRNLDDETGELSRRMRAAGKSWRWRETARGKAYIEVTE